MLPNAGGEVINSVSLPFQSEASLVNSPLILPHTTSRQLQQFPSPVFVRVLTAAETQLLTARIAEDERSNIMAATKSNMLEGSLGTASSGVSRPFVTGFLGSSFSRFTPQITAAQGGFSVEFIGFVESEQVHLHAICILSEILDTHVRKLKSQSHEMQIQIPQVRETFVDSTAVLDVDQTLLLIPLRRDPQGNLSLLLITTQILDVQ